MNSLADPRLCDSSLTPATLGEIATLVSAAVPTDPTLQISGVAALDAATETEISFYSSNKFRADLLSTRAAAVVATEGVNVSADISKFDTNHRAPRPVILFVKDADSAAIKLLRRFAPPVWRPDAGIHPTAIVARSASVGDCVRIGAYVVVGPNATIGARCVIHSGVCIGADTSIGEGCEIFEHVVIRERISIGNRVTIHAGCVIGTDGFGYRWNGKCHEKVPQIGSIVIEDDVEIGACSCIDRAKFAQTRIGRGTKIDNLVQIAHNVDIGALCLIAGQAGIAGSTTLGDGVVLGGQAAVLDHVEIGKGSILAGGSIVYGDIPPNTTVSGHPAGPHRQALRSQVALKKLPNLLKQVQRLQREVDALHKLATK